MSMSIAETEAVFTRAYASSILNKLHIVLSERDAIYLSPIGQRGIAAGDLIPPEVTNFPIFKLGDSLFPADNPSYTGEALESYVHRLWRYLSWVDTEADRSQVAEDRMKEAQHVAYSAAQRYNEVLVEAQAKFIKAKELDSSLEFWTWVVKNAPEVADIEKARNATQVEVSAAADVYFGPLAPELSKYMTHVQNALSQDPSSELNMAIVVDQKITDTIVKKAKGGEPTPQEGWSHAVLQTPLYSIETYASVVQGWINDSTKGGKRNQILRIDVANGRSTEWEDYGFKEVHGDENVGLFPLFSFDVQVDNKTKIQALKTENREDGILLELSMVGLQEFKVIPGEWDVPDVKTRFPKLLPEATEVLDKKNLARATSVIVGYDVELKVTFKGDIGEEVNKMYEEARDSGGSMRIFGVSVSAGNGSDDIKTKFEDVQWNKSCGTMTISLTPTQVSPTILAVLAEKLD